MARNGFMRRETSGVAYYCCIALEELRTVRHGFSTRIGGVRTLRAGSLNLGNGSWDADERVEDNRRRFLEALNLQTSRLATLSQIHSDRVHIIKETGDQWNVQRTQRAEGDALITQDMFVSLAVQVADCLPILIADPKTGGIASIHSGWRGTLARILVKTVQRMIVNFGSDPTHLIVALGPGIRACCFEVGAEVVRAFGKEYPGITLSAPRDKKGRKHLLDLRQALDVQFKETRIRMENVFDLRSCTRCNLDEFFSHRAEGSGSGRMMGLIARVV